MHCYVSKYLLKKKFWSAEKKDLQVKTPDFDILRVLTWVGSKNQQIKIDWSISSFLKIKR